MRIVVLASGNGTLTQAVLDSADSDLTIAAVGSDSPDAFVLKRARAAGVTDFVVPFREFGSRSEWDDALVRAIAAHSPDWVVSAGFMKILGPAVLREYSGRIINTHPALLPSFPGAHGVRDALAYGVRVTGATVHLVDEGVDTGPILEQFPVSVEPDDTESSLHERIKEVERRELVSVLRQLCDHDIRLDGRRARLVPRTSAS